MAEESSRLSLSSPPPHLYSQAAACDYEVAIPTYQRWRLASELGNRRRKDDHAPFILSHTLGFLAEQAVPVSRVTLFVADAEEEKHYRTALSESAWANVAIVVSAPGVLASRNFICQHYAAGTYVVSLDDDLEGISWKFQDGDNHETLQALPPGHLERILFDARELMAKTGAHLWGLNTSQNPRCMSTLGVSGRNGLVNGYFHGFLSRPRCPELLRTLADATEDAEYSVRNFAKDDVVLRYRMYAGVTRAYVNGGGIQAKYISNEDAGTCRKIEEREAAQRLAELFPRLLRPPQGRRGQATMEVSFRSLTNPAMAEFSRLSFRDFQRRLQLAVRHGGATAKAATASTALALRRCGSGRGRTSKAAPLSWDPYLEETPAAGALHKASRPRRRRKGAKGSAAAGLERTAAAKRRRTGRASGNVHYIQVHQEDQISYDPVNPKRTTSKAHGLYARYCKATTIAEARNLGSRSIDFAYDAHIGALRFHELCTRPSSNEVEIRDSPAAAAAAAAAADRIMAEAEPTELRVRAAGLLLVLPPAMGARLKARFPVVHDLAPERLAAGDGPLASVSLPMLRVLLHWCKEGVLSMEEKGKEALRAVLEALGASEASQAVAGAGDQYVDIRSYMRLVPVANVGACSKAAAAPPGKRTTGAASARPRGDGGRLSGEGDAVAGDGTASLALSGSPPAQRQQSSLERFFGAAPATPPPRRTEGAAQDVTSCSSGASGALEAPAPKRRRPTAAEARRPRTKLSLGRTVGATAVA